jgi:hypothetical protein
MKIFKTILIILALMPLSFVQANDNLIVEFETGTAPLFNEANFLPGEGITRWVRVTNNSGQVQRIATQPLNITDPNHLGDVLNLVIKENGATLYNNALSNFFAGGENYLSSLANGTTTRYDFTVSFYSGSQNTFQGKTLGFDILIGFQGTEGGILPGAGSTSGGGGGGPPGMLPPGLTIQNEAITTTTDTSVIIVWTTSYVSTSQVIYALGSEFHILDLTDRIGAPPKYGYTRTTPEYDTFLKVINHSVTIDGLAPGTTYYYRAVSHGSLAISTEHSFTTLTQEEAVAATAMAEEAAEALPTSPAPSPAGVSGVGGGVSEVSEEGGAGEIEITETSVPLGITAAIGMVWKDISQSTFKSILLIILLIILFLLISKEIRRKRKKI